MSLWVRPHTIKVFLLFSILDVTRVRKDTVSAFPCSHSGARVPGNEATPTYIEVSVQTYIDIKDMRSDSLHATKANWKSGIEANTHVGLISASL